LQDLDLSGSELFEALITLLSVDNVSQEVWDAMNVRLVVGGGGEYFSRFVRFLIIE